MPSQNPALYIVFGKGRSTPSHISRIVKRLRYGGPSSFWPIALPWAVEAHNATGVDVSVVLSQWAIETAYGGADWLPPRNNPGNVGNFTAGGQMNYPTLAAGVEGYIQCMDQNYYIRVRTSAGWYAQCLALGQSPWASGRYALPGSYPGSELIYVVQNYNLTQYDAGGPTPAPPIPGPPRPIQVMKPTTGRYGMLNAPVGAILTTRAGDGYHLVAADGGTFDYNCQFIGSLGSVHLNAPIVDAALSPSGNGIYMTATDGGVFCFGDAQFRGSAGSMHLNAPVVSIAVTDTNGGYWLTAADGGVFTYGDAPFEGSPA